MSIVLLIEDGSQVREVAFVVGTRKNRHEVGRRALPLLDPESEPRSRSERDHRHPGITSQDIRFRRSAIFEDVCRTHAHLF